MEGAVQDNGSTLDLKHFFEIVQPSTEYPKQDMTKIDKSAEDNLPDFNLAYLGPLLWNNTLMSDDLNSDSLDFEELLEDGPAIKELSDISSLLPPTDAPKDLHAKELQRTADISGGGGQVLPFSDACFDQFCSPVAAYALPPIPQVSPTTNNASQRLEALHQDPAAGISQNNFSYQPDITDVIISTPMNDQEDDVELFDPTRRIFTDDELKPQPIVRKAKKVYVSKESKDVKYWQKREKNNVAAKRSREARRIKENQIVMRTKFLETENKGLHLKVDELNAEVRRLMKVVEGYQAREAG